MHNKKQEDIYGLGVPELNNVGVACVNHLSLKSSYVSKAACMSSL